MLKNHLLVAFRSAMRHKGYAAINILGLAAGAAVSILMLLFAHNVLTFDAFHDGAEDIYFLYRTRPTPEGAVPVNDTWYPLVDEVEAAFPAVTGGVRFLNLNRWVEHGDRRYLENVTFTDSNLFTVFDGFTLLSGASDQVLADPRSVVVSREVAERYFGQEDPVGQTLTIDFGSDYIVTGVLDEIPANSSIPIDIAAPLRSLPFVAETGWDQSFLFSFVQLAPGASPAALERQFPQIVDRFFRADERGDLKLMPLTEFNDYLTDRDRYAYVLLAIGFGILLIACINFSNLTTARSMLRAREIGMRRVLGAGRGRLVAQFLGEAMLMSFVGLAVGCLLAELMLPAFSDFVDMPLALDLIDHPVRVAALAGLGIVTGLLAGSYPALYLSRLRPLRTLTYGRAPRPAFRNGLVVAQFVLATVLFAGVGVMYLQIRHMKTQDLHFDPERVVVLQVAPSEFPGGDEATGRINAFSREVAGLTGVESVSISSGVPSRYGGSFTLMLPEDQRERSPLDWRYLQVDDAYFNTYGIDFTEGRAFSSEMADENAVILNEAALRTVGWRSGDGRALVSPGSGREWPVIGVVKDFHYQPVSTSIEPVIHFYGGESSGAYRFVSVRFRQGAASTLLDRIRSVWSRFDPSREMDYFFVDDSFAQLYQTEENTARIVAFAAVITILVACMGLLGLASFSVVQRMREIALRKVLGARESSIVAMFATQFARPVLIAVVAAALPAFLLMDAWLREFPYRIDLSRHAALFVAAGVLVLSVAVLTVGLQTLRIARTNPAEVLRHE